MNQNPSLLLSLENSIKLFLDNAVVVPYNAAVVGTGYAAPLQVIRQDPDDNAVYAKVPAIVLEEIEFPLSPVATGVGDTEVWDVAECYMKVYPGTLTDSVSGSIKPSRDSSRVLKSLFKGLMTAITIPIYDVTQTPPVQVNAGYLQNCKVIEPKGAISTLALEKWRFDFRLMFRFPSVGIDG